MTPSPTDDWFARRTHRWPDAHVLPGLLGPLLHDPDVVPVWERPPAAPHLTEEAR